MEVCIIINIYKGAMMVKLLFEIFFPNFLKKYNQFLKCFLNFFLYTGGPKAPSASRHDDQHAHPMF